MITDRSQEVTQNSGDTRPFDIDPAHPFGAAAYDKGSFRGSVVLERRSGGSEWESLHREVFDGARSTATNKEQRLSLTIPADPDLAAPVQARWHLESCQVGHITLSLFQRS